MFGYVTCIHCVEAPIIQVNIILFTRCIFAYNSWFSTRYGYARETNASKSKQIAAVNSPAYYVMHILKTRRYVQRTIWRSYSQRQVSQHLAVQTVYRVTSGKSYKTSQRQVVSTFSSANGFHATHAAACSFD